MHSIQKLHILLIESIQFIMQLWDVDEKNGEERIQYKDTTSQKYLQENDF